MQGLWHQFGNVPVSPFRGIGNTGTRSPFVIFIMSGDTLPPPVYGFMSVCHSLEEFHWAKYHCGFVAVPQLVKIYFNIFAAWS